MWKKLPFLFIVGIILAIVLFSHSAIVNSFDSAYNKLQQNILPQITYQEDFVTDAIANTYSVTRIPEKLPELEQFPVYSAQPYLNESQVYVEIWSSSEKASSEKQTQGWLVDTAEEFNQKQIEVNGKTIRVGIRNIPSILAAQMIVAGKGKPTGYTPSNNFPLAMLESEGIKTILFISITCEITFNLLGIDELIDVAQYLESKSFQLPTIVLITPEPKQNFSLRKNL